MTTRLCSAFEGSSQLSHCFEEVTLGSKFLGRDVSRDALVETETRLSSSFRQFRPDASNKVFTFWVPFFSFQGLMSPSRKTFAKKNNRNDEKTAPKVNFSVLLDKSETLIDVNGKRASKATTLNKLLQPLKHESLLQTLNKEDGDDDDVERKHLFRNQNSFRCNDRRHPTVSPCMKIFCP